MSVLSSFTHITQEITGIRAIVSVQYPELTAMQSLSDSFSKILGNKKAVYLAITGSTIWNVHTVGNKIVRKAAAEANTIDEIQTSNTTLSGGKDVKLLTLYNETYYFQKKRVTDEKDYRNSELYAIQFYLISSNFLSEFEV